MVNNIAFVLAALNARLLLEEQVNMFESSLVTIFAQDFISFALQCQYIVESSAYWRQVHLGTQFFISLTHKSNNTGPKSDSCGTPNFDYKRFEERESICTKWLLFAKYFKMRYKKVLEKCDECILCIRILKSMVSNALEKSAKAAKVTSLLFIARSMSSRSLIRIVNVEWFFLYPD